MGMAGVTSFGTVTFCSVSLSESVSRSCAFEGMGGDIGAGFAGGATGTCATGGEAGAGAFTVGGGAGAGAFTGGVGVRSIGLGAGSGLAGAAGAGEGAGRGAGATSVT